MLSTMRKSAGSWIIKILLGIIVLAFVFMGAGSFYARRTQRVASVNGQTITVNEFQHAYNSLLTNLRNQFNGNLPDSMIKNLNLKKRALDQLVDKTLLTQVAGKLGITVPKEQLVQAITSIPAFQHNGTFNDRRYKYVLGQNHMTPQIFETLQKEAMAMGEVKTLIGNCVHVSDEEVRQWYNWEKSTVNIDYAVFSPDEFTKIQVTDNEIQSYFKAHAKDYQTAPMVKVRYALFSPDNYITEVNVTDDDVAAYYNQHMDNFKHPESVTAREILLKLDRNADKKEVDKKHEEALMLIKKADAGKDFAELAKKYSEGPSAKNGGLIGPLTKKEMLKPIADAAFSLKPGEISKPVRTQNGWHVIKVVSDRKAGVDSLDQVKDKIRKILEQQRARSIAYDKALAAYNVSYDGPDLVKNSKTMGFPLKETGFFSRTKGPKGIDDAGKFADIAFELQMNDVSNIKEIGNSYYLMQLVARQPEKIPPLDSVKDRVKADVLHEKEVKAAETAAKKFLKEVKSSGNMAEAARKEGIDTKTTGFFTQRGPVPGIGRNRDIITTAFSLTDKNPVPDHVIKSGNHFYVIALKEIKLPAKKTFLADKDKIHSQLMARKRMAMIDSWMAGLRQRSQIKIYKAFSQQ